MLLSSPLFSCRVYHIVKLYFSYAIFVTLLVQFYVPMDFLEPPLIRWLGVNYEFVKISVFRIIIITITGTYCTSPVLY